MVRNDESLTGATASSWNGTRATELEDESNVAKVVPNGPDCGEVEPCFILWWMKNRVTWIRLQDWWR